MKFGVGRAGPLGRTLAAVAVSSCFAAPALANPTGANVVRGTAAIHQAGNLLQITNSPNAIINWQSFSIGANEITRFIQQSSSSAVLNRVITQNPSQILGALQSNGRVFLINPNGILFGAGAQVDVAGLVASTLNMSDGDFLGGRLRFTDGLGKSVVNDGSIATGAGGSVYLIGSGVTNNGIIRSPQGEVVLAAGNSVELVSPGTPNLRVEIAAADNEARNLGQIISEAGRIGIYAGLINNSGQIRADSAVVEGGRIVLKATKSATLAAGSVTSANGASGGSITVQSGDTTLVSGAVEAKGLGSPPAGGGVAPSGDGVVGEGGTIQILGNLVGLTDGASIDASGEAGGGAVLVGGDFQGKNPEVQNAFRTYVGPDATIKADAITSGDGGKVIVWSDDTTRFYGHISARGGASSGNGGFAEVSGKEFLAYRGTADLRAPAGSFGTLLLDPRDITIQASGLDDSQLDPNVPTLLDPTGSIFFADGGGTTDFTLTASTISGSTANVVLQAQRDVNINSAVNITTPGVGLTAQAGRDINVNAALTTNAGKIILEADSPHQPGLAPDGIGLVNISAPVNSCGGAVSASCTGANITLIGGGASSPTGGFVLNADVNAGTGGINVALSTNTSGLDFFIGAGGNTQLSSNDTGSLKTTGTLVLGRAVSGGPNGLGAPITEDPATGAVTLTVNSLSQLNANPMTLSAESGSTFQLVAGDGGITLDRNLTTFQSTVIETTGTFTLSAALDTSNNNLLITAAAVDTTGGSITTGTGLFACTASVGCPSGSVVLNQWNIDASGDWLVDSNWSLGHRPKADEVALIDRTSGTYTIALGSASTPANESVGLLLNHEVLNVTGNASNKTTLNISDSFVFGGSSASINFGTLNLTDSILGGSGALANQGTLTLTNSAITTALTNQLSASMTVSGTSAINGLFTMSGGTLDINNGAQVTVGELILDGGSVGGTGSLTVTTDFFQTSGTLGTTLTDLALHRNGDFIVGAAGYTATNSVQLTAAGGITLNGTVGADGTGDAVVLAGTTFTNNAGSSALSAPNGRWLVWSADPASDNRGSLVYDFKQYDATFGSTTVLGTGDGFLYTVAPTITPSLTGSATKVYDGNVTAPTGALVLSGTGAIDGDVVVLATAGATYDTKHVDAGKSVTANGLSVTGSNGAATVYGYQLSSPTASANVGQITPATLTYLADAASRERGDPNVLSGIVAGFVGGETLATATSGTLGFTSPATQSSLEGVYAVNGGGLTASNGNYVFVQAPGNATALTVTPPVNFAWASATGGAWETGSNWSKGFAPVNGAVVTIPDLTGSATVTYSSGVTSVKSVTSFEGLTVAGGTLNLGASPVDVSTFHPGAPLTLTGGTLGGAGTLTVLSSLNLNGGTLTGGLSIAANVANMGGTVTPGASPGALTINGNYVQGPNGTLVVEIGGATAGLQYDQLIVNGNAILGGTLRVYLVNGFAPGAGETFTVVQSSGSLSGTFSNTIFPANSTFSAGYLPASMFVSVSGLAVPPPAAVAAASQIVIAITDQNQNTLVASQVTGLPVEVLEQQQERQETKKKPMCNASSGGGGGLSGGGGHRCNTRGCF